MSTNSGRRLALLITNNAYSDSAFSDLTTPKQDGEDLSVILEDPAIAAFDEVTHLHDRSSAEIRRAIVGFYQDKRRDDLLFFYFSGHGVLNDQTRILYFAVHDTEKAFLSANGIQAGFVDQQMKQCRSRRKIVVPDCCHSGAYLEGSKGSDIDINTGAIFDPSGYGHYILTATDRLQQAWEGHKINPKYKHSLFTHHLIEGLATGAAGRATEPQIAMDDLRAYIDRQILEEENQSRRQTPKSWSGDVAGELFIAKNVAYAPSKMELKQLRTGDVWAFIDGLPSFNQRAIGIDLGIDEVDELGAFLEAVGRKQLNSELIDALWDYYPIPFREVWGERDKVSYSRITSVEENSKKQKKITDDQNIAKPSQQFMGMSSGTMLAAIVGVIIALLIFGAFINFLINGPPTVVTQSPQITTEASPANASSEGIVFASPGPPTAEDSDGDGLTDDYEINSSATDPNNPDDDGDGIIDGDEIFKYNTSATQPDTDYDGILDPDEIRNGTNPRATEEPGSV